MNLKKLFKELKPLSKPLVERTKRKIKRIKRIRREDLEGYKEEKKNYNRNYSQKNKEKIRNWRNEYNTRPYVKEKAKEKRLERARGKEQ